MYVYIYYCHHDTHIYIYGYVFFWWVQSFKVNRSRGTSNHTSESYPPLLLPDFGTKKNNQTHTYYINMW